MSIAKFDTLQNAAGSKSVQVATRADTAGIEDQGFISFAFFD